MKRINLIAAIIFAGLLPANALAQFGVHLGFAPQKLVEKNYFSEEKTLTHSDTINMSGFYIGADYNFHISGNFGLLVGAQFRSNTCSKSITTPLDVTLNNGGSPIGKSFSSSGVPTATVTMKQTLIDIPVLLNYGFDIYSNLTLSLFLGATVNFALSGTTTYDFSTSEVQKIDDWYHKDRYQPFDISSTVGLALSFGKFRIFGGYHRGMEIYNAQKLSDNSIETRQSSNFFAGIGLHF